MDCCNCISYHRLFFGGRYTIRVTPHTNPLPRFFQKIFSTKSPILSAMLWCLPLKFDFCVTLYVPFRKTLGVPLKNTAVPRWFYALIFCRIFFWIPPRIPQIFPQIWGRTRSNLLHVAFLVVPSVEPFIMAIVEVVPKELFQWKK